MKCIKCNNIDTESSTGLCWKCISNTSDVVVTMNGTNKGKSLRDNSDGTCNCSPLGNSCFFTNGFGGRCDCKCHFPNETNKEWAKSLEFVLENIDEVCRPGSRAFLISFIDSLLSKKLSQKDTEWRERIRREIDSLVRYNMQWIDEKRGDRCGLCEGECYHKDKKEVLEELKQNLGL